MIQYQKMLAGQHNNYAGMSRGSAAGLGGIIGSSIGLGITEFKDVVQNHGGSLAGGQGGGAGFMKSFLAALEIDKESLSNWSDGNGYRTDREIALALAREAERNSLGREGAGVLLGAALGGTRRRDGIAGGANEGVDLDAAKRVMFGEEGVDYAVSYLAPGEVVYTLRNGRVLSNGDLQTAGAIINSGPHDLRLVKDNSCSIAPETPETAEGDFPSNGWDKFASFLGNLLDREINGIPDVIGGCPDFGPAGGLKLSAGLFRLLRNWKGAFEGVKSGFRALKGLFGAGEKVGAINVKITGGIDSLENTAGLLDLFAKGRGLEATRILEELSKTKAGRIEIENMQKIASVLLPKAKSPEASNALMSLQAITRYLSRSAK